MVHYVMELDGSTAPQRRDWDMIPVIWYAIAAGVRSRPYLNEGAGK